MNLAASTPVFPAKAGIQVQPKRWQVWPRLGPMIWAPAFAGETEEKR